MRVRLLREHYFWDAFVLDVDKEIRTVKKSNVVPAVKSLFKEYFITYALLTDKYCDSVDTASLNLYRATGIMTDKHEKKSIVFRLYYIEKSIGYENLKLFFDDNQKEFLTISDIFGGIVLENINIKVSYPIGKEFIKSLQKKLSSQPSIHVLDGISMELLVQEYKRRRMYGKYMNLKYVAKRVREKIYKQHNISEYTIYKEIKKRIYHRFVYRYLRRK